MIIPILAALFVSAVGLALTAIALHYDEKKKEKYDIKGGYTPKKPKGKVEIPKGGTGQSF